MDDPLADELRNHWTSQFDRTLALLIIADEHLEMRRSERALAIWQQLISEGGSAADSARVDYANFLLEEGRSEEAWCELDEVMNNGRIYGSAWCTAAELLERRGELDEALVWYEIAADNLTAEDVRDPRRIQDLVTGRRRVKWKLRLPLDGIDLLGDQGEDEAADREADLHDLLRAPAVHEGRIQVWDRGEFDDDIRWRRHLIGENANSYFHMAERVMRADGGRVMVETWTYGGLLDCLQDVTIRHHALPDGRRVAWPPPRNQPCWCGSGVKYKKCCGGPLPGLDPAVASAPAHDRYRVAHGG